ncbi:MAG: PAC2 family protein [candidate division WOR-3 bacterium]|nr:PAC2 family protein [candidate division WOR-3 bacterium]
MNFSGIFSKKIQIDNLIKWIKKPPLDKPVLFIIWEKIPGKIGEKIFQSINEKANIQIFCEIIPAIFYPLNGVEIENDVAFIPYNRFYFDQKRNLVIFRGYEPQLNHYQFVLAIVDVVCSYLSVSEIYTLNSFVSNLNYNAIRKIWSVYNNGDIQEKMKNYGLHNMTYEGPPAISSYILYIARERNLPGVSLWCEIPFYLSLVDDFQSQKVVMQFLNDRFGFGFDFSRIDSLCNEQKERLLRLRMTDKKVDRYLWSIEMNISLTEEESLYLTNKIHEELNLHSK